MTFGMSLTIAVAIGFDVGALSHGDRRRLRRRAVATRRAA